MGNRPPEDADPGLRFQTTPYEPEGGCPPLGFLLILLLSVPFAVAAGYVTVKIYPYLFKWCNNIDNWYFYFFAFLMEFLLLSLPMILAFYAGVWLGKVRNS